MSERPPCPLIRTDRAGKRADGEFALNRPGTRENGNLWIVYQVSNLVGANPGAFAGSGGPGGLLRAGKAGDHQERDKRH